MEEDYFSRRLSGEKRVEPEPRLSSGSTLSCGEHMTQKI